MHDLHARLTTLEHHTHTVTRCLRWPRHAALLLLGLCLLLVASITYAADVYDATGKRIGTVIAHEPYPHRDPWPATAIGTHKGVAYTLRLGRTGVAMQEWLYYTSPDCTGSPVYPMDPSYRTHMLVMPSGMDLQGTLWIVRRITMPVVVLRSFVYSGGGYEGLDPASCETLGVASGEEGQYVSPMMKVGNIQQLYKTPYVVK